MLSAPFAQVLAAGRTGFNDRVARALARDRTFNAEAFGAYLVDHVDPLMAGVPGLSLPGVVDAAFDLALDAVGRSVNATQARQLWADVAPRYMALLAAHPRDVLAMLGNALAHLHGLPGARPQAWVAGMAAIAPNVTTLAQLRAVGQVLAWRAGAAHFRQGALEAADALPATLACAAFGAPEIAWTALRQQLRDEPWWRAPADVLGNVHARLSREVGAFDGFGGAFPVPPQVRACVDGFLVRSGDRHCLLVADAYGAVLHGATFEQYDAAHEAFAPRCTLVGTVLSLGARTVELDLPPEGLAACCNAASVAVTSPYTHAIRVLALA